MGPTILSPKPPALCFCPEGFHGPSSQRLCHGALWSHQRRPALPGSWALGSPSLIWLQSCACPTDPRETHWEDRVSCPLRARPSAGESPVDDQHPLPLQVRGCSPTRQGCRSWQTSSRWGPPPRGCGASFPFLVEAGGASFCRAAVDSRRGEGQGSPSTCFKSALQGWFPLAPSTRRRP